MIGFRRENKGGFLSGVSKTWDNASDSAAKLVEVAETMRVTSENYRTASENARDASQHINVATLTASRSIKNGLDTLSYSLLGSMTIWAAVSLIKLKKK